MDYYLAGFAQALKQFAPALQRGNDDEWDAPLKARPPPGGFDFDHETFDPVPDNRDPDLVFNSSNWISPQERRDYEEALRLQEEFQAEEESLRLQMQMLEEEAQEREFLQMVQEQEKGFDCGICMDEMPLSDIAKVDGCGHEICRECLRGYVTTKINDRKYPIPCPLCIAGPAKEGEPLNPRMITEGVILLLGVPEEEFMIFEELQLNEFSVPIDCRGCKRSVKFDRQQFQETEILTCPLFDCGYHWCKTCQQAVDPNGPKHSCDGTNEFNLLIEQEGWKRCPECKTPVQKESGCNHMTCITPGCNTCFCYKCAGVISRGFDGNAKMAHLNGPCGFGY
ncbi:hypothetical protein BDN72DRAFT_816260 [Pluteus cervinus]|uniref:Uncharacterized protein n=1 Tax=Pluteus cervinus TaxID=181527 RepID=A0ACD3B3B2_9AGAR|nr:hypothetical protein BDN72DRAFT_816260 [Pluteus cervinus]